MQEACRGVDELCPGGTVNVEQGNEGGRQVVVGEKKGLWGWSARRFGR